MKFDLRLVAVATLWAAIPLSASAHFPWLAIDKDGKAIYFFGENIADRSYKMPDTVAKAKVTLVGGASAHTSLPLVSVDSEDFVGLRSSEKIPAGTSLASKVTYGIYHGSRLDYYTQHLGGALPTSRKAYEGDGKSLELRAEIIDTKSGVDVFVIWKGVPLADAKVTLMCQEGHKEGEGKTDDTGKISFSDQQVEEGLNGIMVGYTAKGESGKLGDQAYQAVSHYLTATFLDPEDAPAAKPEISVSVSSTVYPSIPEEVTSFGAAVSGEKLYVYGGHKGRAHQYYAEAQANTLWQLDLKQPKTWESLGTGPGLQGLAMVAHDGKLYRMGGFTAKNREGEEKDLWSQRNATCFDPKSQTWRDLPPLPEPRSSFDAAVLGDQIYVIGGWSMQGGGDVTWLKTAHRLDLSKEPLQWQALPQPPFQRRALSVAAHDGKVFAIGGMQQTGGPSTRVDVYDTKSQSWTRGPSLEGEGMDGFGSSAFAVGGQLYVTTYSGSLQRLSEDGKSWRTLKLLQRDRFFHRLLPLSDHKLLAIGGASMTSGKYEELDVIEIQ